MLLLHALPQLPPWYALALAALPALLPWRGRALYAAFALGLLWTHWRVEGDLARQWPPARHGEERPVEGRIASLPEPGPVDAQGRRQWRFQFEPLTRRADQADLPRRLRVSWYRAEAQLRAGECWRLQLRLRTPHGSFNPGGFDYEGWLFRQGIGATATVREAQRCAAPAAGRWLVWREALRQRYAQWLPQHPGLPLLAALTIGDDSGLGDRDWEVFRLTGTSHLVAISGFNVALVAGFAFLLGRALWSLWPPLSLRLPAQRAGLLASAAAGLAYAFLAGWEPPVQRAALMLLALLAAAWWNRLRHPARMLALAWIAVLLLQPTALLSPGLWLSFAAVAAIFYVSTARVAPAPAWRETLRVQWVLTLALVPLSLFFFHGSSAVAPLVNLVAVPVVAVLTPLALVALLLALAWPAAGVPLLGLVASALDVLRAGLAQLAGLAQPSWVAASPPVAALLLALLGLLLWFAPRGLPLRLPALLCLLPLLWPPQRAPQAGFEVAMLDVGQGLSVLVRTPRHALLYDFGPAFDDGFDAGASVVVPYLLQAGLHRVDAFVLSHPDQDHAGGLPAVQRLIGAAQQYGTPAGTPCSDGMAWDWDGVHFEFLHPQADEVASDNDRSCVLRVSQGERSLLLAGDIGAAAERRLVARHAARLRSELLAAPHHGSRSSSSAEFVAAVQPRVVLYGAAWRSHFRHPRPEVVARYAALGARQYVTGVSGALELRLQGGEWTVREHRRESAHWWNAAAEP